jgi:hypothetical protein
MKLGVLVAAISALAFNTPAISADSAQLAGAGTQSCAEFANPTTHGQKDLYCHS